MFPYGKGDYNVHADRVNAVSIRPTCDTVSIGNAA